MGLYVRKKDRLFFDQINRELIEKNVEVQVLLFRLDLDATRENIYHESINRYYKEPIKIFCLITYQEVNTESSEFGKDIKNGVTFRFHRISLEKVNVVPMAGDIIKWNDYFFEVDTVMQATQYPGQEYPFSFYVVNAHMTRVSKLSIIDYKSGVIKEYKGD